MLALLAAALVAAGPDSVIVRGVSRDTVLGIVAGPSGGMLRADVVLPLLGGSVRDLGRGRWTLIVGGATIELSDGVPTATHRGEVVPLAGAPVARDGTLLIPLDLLTEVAPRLGDNLIWDADRRELRVFRGIVRRAVPASPKDTRMASSVTPAPSRPPARRHLVVVDAGHGGPDAGMHGPIGGRTTLLEKDITLAVAQRLAGELRDRGVEHAHVAVDVAEPDAQVGEVGAQIERLRVLADRLVEHREPRVRRAEVGVHVGELAAREPVERVRLPDRRRHRARVDLARAIVLAAIVVRDR